MKYTQKPGKTPAFTGIYQEIPTDTDDTDELIFCTIGVEDSYLPPTNNEKNVWLWISNHIAYNKA